MRGMEELRAAMRRLADRGVDAAEEAVGAQTTFLVAAGRDMTPVDLGPLQDSYVQIGPLRFQGGAKIRYTVEVGGWLAPYAVYVHENLDARHTNGTAKFLERAITRNQGVYASIWETMISQRLAL